MSERKDLKSLSESSSGENRGVSHLDVLSGDFTFKPGRFLLYNLDIMERLSELDVRSCSHKQAVINRMNHSQILKEGILSLRRNQRFLKDCSRLNVEVC